MVGEVGRDHSTGTLVVEVVAEVEIGVLRNGPDAEPPRSRASRSVGRGVGRVDDAIDLLPRAAADVAGPDLVCAGAEREPERVSLAVGDDSPLVGVGAAEMGVAGQAWPVSGSSLRMAPFSPVGSLGLDGVRMSWLRRAPPSAVGGVSKVPGGLGGSPQGLTGFPSCP